MKIVLQVIVVAVLTLGLYCKDLILNLERSQVPPFRKYNDADYKGANCNLSVQKKSFSKKISTPVHCGTDTETVKITSPCVQRNLYYKTQVRLGRKKSSKSKYRLFSLALDLQSPWTWVKAQDQCAQYSRDGVQNTSDSCEIENYSTQYSCLISEKCNKIEKCAEIDFTYEGLSVVGQFVDTVVSFKDIDKKGDGIQKQRIVYTYGLSGHEQFQADGVLGLGKPHKELIMSSLDDETPQEKDSDSEVEDSDYEEDVKEALVEGDLKNFEVQKYEENTNLFKNMYDRYENDEEINEKLFSLFIADNYEENIDDDFKPHVQIGGFNSDKYVYDVENNPIRWVTLEHSRYFLWEVNIKAINVIRNEEQLSYNELYRDQFKYNRKKSTVSNFQETGILSLSTTALSLPEGQLKQLLQMFDQHFLDGKFQCKYDKTYMYTVYCTGLKSPLEFRNMYISIDLDNEFQLVINPKDLVQKCDIIGKSSKTYTCLLNIQQSLDGHVLLGEAVLKNYYWVFDMFNQKVGFAPAKNEYNEEAFKVFVKQTEDEVEAAVQAIGHDIEFMFRFSAVIILVVVAYFAFRNIDFVIGIIDKCFGGRNRGARIKPHLLPQDNNFQQNDDFIDLRQEQQMNQQAPQPKKKDLELIKQFEEFDNLATDASQQINLLDGDDGSAKPNPFDEFDSKENSNDNTEDNFNRPAHLDEI